MNDYLKTLAIAQGLETLREAMAICCGGKWEEIVAEQRPMFEDIMRSDGHGNPLLVALPIAKKMKANGEKPDLILAVAAEIAYRMKTEEAAQ